VPVAMTSANASDNSRIIAETSLCSPIAPPRASIVVGNASTVPGAGSRVEHMRSPFPLQGRIGEGVAASTAVDRRPATDSERFRPSPARYSFDHLVGPQQERLRNCHADPLSGLKVDR